jgi:hypothetical protein
LEVQRRKTTGNIVASRADTPLERESIYSSIGAYVETILGCNQRLEAMKPRHCGTRAVKDYLDYLASVSPEAVQPIVTPIVTLSADHPDDRIGVSGAGRHNRRACTAEAAAPSRAESGR